MLFRRRDKPSRWHRFKVWVWPRVSWRRSAHYYLKRTLRLSGTPYAIAIGIASGAAVSCAPLIGFHFLVTVAFCWLVRGNMIAGAIGTAVGNPLTFPFIWAATYEIGHRLLRGFSRDAPPRLGYDLTHKSWDQLWPVLKPMLVGSVPVGLALGCIVYIIVYKAVAAYQRARRDRFALRRGADPFVE